MKSLKKLSTENIKAIAEQLLATIKDRLYGEIQLEEKKMSDAIAHFSIIMLRDSDHVIDASADFIYTMWDIVELLRELSRLSDKADGTDTEDEDTIDRLKKNLDRYRNKVDIESNIKNSLYSFLVENRLMNKYQKWYELNGSQRIDWESYAQGKLKAMEEES